MARKVTTVLSLRDNYTAVMKKARRYTSAFDKDVKKMTARLDAASKKKHDIKVKNSAAMKAMNALEKKIAPMRNVMVKVAAHIQHFKNQIKPVTDTFKKITGKAWTITLKVKDGVSFVLTKINTALKKIGKGIAIGAAAVIAAGGYALSKGMALEGYDVSMGHFVGVNNPNSSNNQVKAQTDAYLKWLRENANATPFGTEEIIQAGSRAVQIAEGNTNAARGLVKMAEDMAALTPGKTVMDAMEALADAQMGEFERMKEFGFKMSAKEFKKAGYDLFSTKSTTGKTLVQVFGGGAEKFSKTTTGMWSTITGEIESDIADIGLEMAKGLKPLLEWIRYTVLPDLKKWLFDPIKGTGKTGMETLTQGIKDVYYWLKDQIPAAIESMKSLWQGFANWFNDPNGILRQALNFFNIQLPAISGSSGSSGTSNPTKPSGDPLNLPASTIPGNTPYRPREDVEEDYNSRGKRKLTLEDAFNTYVNLKIASLGLRGANLAHKIFSGKGLIAKGGKQIWNGAKWGGRQIWNGAKLGAAAVNNGAVALAGASPAANAAMVNGTAFMAGGGNMLLPGASVWLDNQMRVAAAEYYAKTGKYVDGSTIPGANKLIGWKMDLWGQNLNASMDALFGIKRKDGSVLPYSATHDAVQQVIDGSKALQTVIKTTPDTSGLTNIQNQLTGIGNAAKYAADQVSILGGKLIGPSSTQWGGGGVNTRMPKAAGIKRVPYDNYPALLHKGETVLNSAEAGEYRGHGNQAKAAPNIIQNNYFTVSGAADEASVNRIASVIVRKLQSTALNMA